MDYLPDRLKIDLAIQARFEGKFTKTDGCWTWNKVNNQGYGFFRIEGKTYTAHRAAYLLRGGRIPTGYSIDHLCKNRSCVKPSHLEAVPHRTNLLRGNTSAALRASLTHCPQGHEYNEENTRVYRNMRYCRVCDRIRKSKERNE